MTLMVPVGIGLVALAMALQAERSRRPVAAPPSIGSSAGARMPVWLQSKFDQAGLRDTASGIVVGAVGLVVLGAVVSVASASVVPVAISIAPVLIGVAVLLTVFRSRRDRLIVASLPAALEAMGRAVRSGATFSQAVAETTEAISGPLQREFVELERRLELGQGFGVVMDDWAVRRPLPAVRLACAALEFSHDSGGLSRAIDGVADSLRDHAALDVEIAALASQARLSALVVAALPLGFVGLSTSVDSGVATFLFASPLGLACLVGGIGLDVVGFVWMRHMTVVLS